jgi:DNA replication protein DnaC
MVQNMKPSVFGLSKVSPMKKFLMLQPLKSTKRLSRLLLELTQAKAEGTYYKKLKQLAKVQMMVIDDWGLEPLKPAQRNDLMEITDDRHGHTSTVAISQLPTDEWYASIGDNTLADAILDRLMHNAHRPQLKGESMRKIMGAVDSP